MSLKIHVICLALNEEIFIEEFISALYPFVKGISVITQYDRDYYGNKLIPDSTVKKVIDYPDPDGKIHLIVRRFMDETSARNHEILSLLTKPYKGIIPHGVALTKIKEFYEVPDYFLIADADEIYDPETFPRILDYLANENPRGMRVTGYNYYFTWNQRVPKSYEHFVHFGFIKPTIRFNIRRWITFNETRLRKQLNRFKIRDFSAKLFGFIECPENIGVFHHGAYLGDEKRHRVKLEKHSHKFEFDIEKYLSDLKKVPLIKVANKDLPKIIVNGSWPKNFFLD